MPSFSTRLRWFLVGAAALPFCVYLLSLFIFPDQMWNVHDGVYAPLLLCLSSVVVAAIAEFYAVGEAVFVLWRVTEQRTLLNLTCTAIGSAYLLVCAFGMLWVAFKSAN